MYISICSAYMNLDIYIYVCINEEYTSLCNIKYISMCMERGFYFHFKKTSKWEVSAGWDARLYDGMLLLHANFHNERC